MRIYGTDPHIVAEIDHDDIVVRNVLVTAFGYNDPYDLPLSGGTTASGVRNGPDVMGCALPINSRVNLTHDSPLAFSPPLPWGILVKFWRGEEASPSITVPLIDNGPDIKHYPDHGADLCAAPAHFFAPNIPLNRLCNEFEVILSYRIINGAKYVPVSLIIR